MSAVMYFNSGSSSRHAVMKAANIPCGEYTVDGSMRKDKARVSGSIRKTQSKEKKRRRMIRQAKLAAKLSEKEGRPSYGSGMFNEVDPLELCCESSDDSDGVPLAQLLAAAHSESSDDSDDAPLAQLHGKGQKT